MSEPPARVCVYCASSRKSAARYLDAAYALGAVLAGEGFGLVYGGGSTGCMGQVADGALEAGGSVVGVIPRMLEEMEFAHRGLAELHVVEDLHARKGKMLSLADAVVALPGGSGTLEELLEAITWKRLGLFVGPIVMVNLDGFFDPCLALLDRAIEERFMDARHRAMWGAVSSVDEVVDALRAAPGWDPSARTFATV